MPRFIASPAKLKQAGILGINRRNLSYILNSNKRSLYPRVDNKLLTKEICEEHSIPVPTTYGVIRSQGDLQDFQKMVAGHQDFVVKPACGAAGRGILVIASHDGQVYQSPSGRKTNWPDLRYHVSAIVSGLYSLGGRADCAIVEQRIVTHPELDAVSVGGTPDVRVILYYGVPVMAMVRLPTEASGGRANLHQGAIAVAVDLVTGTTYGGVCENRTIDRHPDTKGPIAGIELPGWRELIDASLRLGDALELGYLGVDFVIDANRGPVVLEANARPGLAIQVAHRQGLLPRLRRVRQKSPSQRTGEARLALIAELSAMRRGTS